MKHMVLFVVLIDFSGSNPRPTAVSGYQARTSDKITVV
jgi:hypothetical protein